VKKDDDEQLRQRFAELRRVDRAAAPKFGTALQSAPTAPTARTSHAARASVSQGGARRLRRGTLAFVAALIAAVAFGVSQFSTSQPHAAAEPPLRIAAWRAGSDALLESTPHEIFGMIPPLRSSVLDTLIR
jgi:hypothetical protein